MNDYYQILGIRSTASLEEIKRAYRLYASKFHPDKHSGDKFFEERFKEIHEAYQTLSDSAKRHEYDQRIVNARPYSSKEAKTKAAGKKISDNIIPSVVVVAVFGIILLGFSLSDNDKVESRVATKELIYYEARVENSIEIILGPTELYLGQPFYIKIEAKNERIKNYTGFPEIQSFSKSGIESFASSNIVEGDTVTIQSIVQYYTTQRVGYFEVQPFVIGVNGMSTYNQGGSLVVMSPSPIK